MNQSNQNYIEEKEQINMETSENFKGDQQQLKEQKEYKQNDLNKKDNQNQEDEEVKNQKTVNQQNYEDLKEDSNQQEESYDESDEELDNTTYLTFDINGIGKVDWKEGHFLYMCQTSQINEDNYTCSDFSGSFLCRYCKDNDMIQLKENVIIEGNSEDFEDQMIFLQRQLRLSRSSFQNIKRLRIEYPQLYTYSKRDYFVNLQKNISNLLCLEKLEFVVLEDKQHEQTPNIYYFFNQLLNNTDLEQITFSNFKYKSDALYQIVSSYDNYKLKKLDLDLYIYPYCLEELAKRISKCCNLQHLQINLFTEGISDCQKEYTNIFIQEYLKEAPNKDLFSFQINTMDYCSCYKDKHKKNILSDEYDVDFFIEYDCDLDENYPYQHYQYGVDDCDIETDKIRHKIIKQFKQLVVFDYRSPNYLNWHYYSPDNN